MKANLIKLTLLVAVLSACKVISFFPLYSPNVVVERQAIQGKYQVDGDAAVYIYKQAYLWKAFEEKEPLPSEDYVLPNGMKIPSFIVRILRDKVHSPSLQEGERTEESRKYSLPYFKSGYIVIEDRRSEYPFPTEIDFDEDEVGAFLNRFALYRIVLLELEDQLYADVCAFQENAGFHLASDGDFIPVHSFAKVQMNEDGFKLDFLSDDYLEDLFEQNRIRLPHVSRSENGQKVTLLTASPEELQKFLVKFGADKEAFDVVRKYYRENV